MAAQTPTYSEEAALSLTLAIVASSPGPLLLLDGDLRIVAASASSAEAFEIDVLGTPGVSLSSLGAGEWNLPQLRSLLDATLAGAAKIEAYEMDLKRPGRPTRRLVVHAQRLVYLDADNQRLLVAVTDVTDARASEAAKDEALRHNLILLQEVRHRVANSLQIIASVLLQNARKTDPDETRSHLNDAHNRVMSVAALERQLAGSGEAHVELSAYFTNLCSNLAASMIADSEHISLVVTGARGVVEARVSVSLGLIVTELVINALKYAFPDRRPGKIAVDCKFQGPNWTLTVADNGVGMPSDPALVQVGLGTSIVRALVKQLSATLEIAPAHPGTRVTIDRTRIALVDDDAGGVAANSAAGHPVAQAS
ncbi:sensor histidine kinase [Phenylobacterium sp.]|uniref:sensor histidine kinase n=1 Tax=Phenylobacterium sp. TaxID=1871053 RepID=UPI0025E65118|nr:sensor histidine kinase [Phenylobacterium sp.]